MTITITVADTNNDGVGVNLEAYFASFEASFTPSGRGQFSGSDMISGKQYAITGTDGYGVILTASQTDWADLRPRTRSAARSTDWPSAAARR